MSLTLLAGDVLDVLAQLPAESVHCTVTSPPYWSLRDYGVVGRVWGGSAECCHVWEVGARDGETYVGQKRWQHEGVSRQETPEQWLKVGRNDTGRDMGGGRGGNYRDGEGPHQTLVAPGVFCQHCGAWFGALGLEPTPELYVEHMVQVFRAVRRVLRKDGTCWLNLGDSYSGSGVNDGSKSPGLSNAAARGNPVERPSGKRWTQPVKRKDLIGIPWRVALALQADGWYLRSDIIWSKRNPMPESVTDRPTRSHEYIFLLSRSERYFYDAEAVRERQNPLSAGRYKYAFTGGKGKTIVNNRRTVPEGMRIASNGRNRRSVWEIAVRPFAGAHFATFPPDLVRPCILAGSSAHGCCAECGAPWVRVVERTTAGQGTAGEGGRQPEGHSHDRVARGELKRAGDTISATVGWAPTCKHDAQPVPSTVLDPFVGAGTTAMVALLHGRDAIGIDLNLEYLAMARERIEKALRRGRQEVLAL